MPTSCQSLGRRDAGLFARSLGLFGLITLAACSSTSNTAVSAFSFPIDMSYACEGDGKTVAPANDETASTLDQTRMCADLADGSQGNLFGVVLDRQPPQLFVMQMNPAASTRRIVDVDLFIPGVNGIPVGRDPIRVLRAPDWSTFYVVSAGDRRIDRVSLVSLADVAIDYEQSTLALPGVPLDAEVLGDFLVVAARDAAEVWVFDLSKSTSLPPMSVLPMPDKVAHLAAIDGRWLVTFRNRPTVAVIDPDGTVLQEEGLVAQCRDGLDNDGDGKADREDPDCKDRDDDDEGTTSGAERVAVAPAAPAFDGAAPCANGVDDDGDGMTDYPDDAACADADDDGELQPQCDDGIDNDGDGQSDLADPSCYSATQLVEQRLPSEGPFHPTFIDGGSYGRFAYVLDERLGEIAVFAWSGTALTRVDVNAENVDPPAIDTVPFDSFDSEVTERLAVPVVRPPALHRQGKKNIQITDSNAFGLTNGRLRGETWERLLTAPEGESASVPLNQPSSLWKPSVCAPTPTDRCVQPPLDDATWFAFGPNLDGRIQLIESIRRGVPVHRLAQRTTDLSLRTHGVSAPRLSRRTTLVNARGEPQVGLPFVGAALEEVLVERVDDESPQRVRRYGVWPPADLEEAPTETWTVTYEGAIPGANGRLGHLADDTTFVDANATFCESGVTVGDRVQLEVPVASVDPALVHTLEVTLKDGRKCPTREAKTALVEVSITAVGMTSLTLDPSSARLRPQLPELDLVALETSGLSKRACNDAVKALDETLGLADKLVASEDFAAAALPPALTYAVRAKDWVIVGTRSGFLHRQKWNRATSACEVDETLDPRLTGRATEVADAVSKYETCPPPAAQLAEDRVTSLAPAAGRFVNPSFELDIFPACSVDTQGVITPVASQQDTSFSFVVTGPQQGSALTVSDSVLITRVPLLDFRRQQVQLDTAARRALVLQYRLGDPKLIATFE
jgi:hypothetical protein